MTTLKQKSLPTYKIVHNWGKNIDLKKEWVSIDEVKKWLQQKQKMGKYCPICYPAVKDFIDELLEELE